MAAIGDPAPDFRLPDTDGAEWGLGDRTSGIGAGKESAARPPGTDRRSQAVTATVIVFTCNHCPYALAWHQRIASAARDYARRGVSFLAINANDGDRYPRDSYEAMQRRVADEDWPMPYLHDATQEVAHAYGAKTTPDVFVIDADGTLRYRGAPDADYDDPGQDARWLREALDAILAGRDLVRTETKPVGCSIKYRP